MIDVRWPSRDQNEGPVLRTREDALRWFLERGFSSCEACGWEPVWHPSHAAQPVRRLRRLALHHIIPRKAGGRNTQGNLTLLCHNCHSLAHFVWRMKWDRGRALRRYLGPRGRTQFLIAMRELLADPQGWYERNREEQTWPGFSGTH